MHIQTHTHTHMHLTECSTWTTKVGCKRLKTLINNIMHNLLTLLVLLLHLTIQDHVDINETKLISMKIHDSWHQRQRTSSILTW